jgi:hypothetical protein
MPANINPETMALRVKAKKPINAAFATSRCTVWTFIAFPLSRYDSLTAVNQDY